MRTLWKISKFSCHKPDATSVSLVAADAAVVALELGVDEGVSMGASEGSDIVSLAAD